MTGDDQDKALRTAVMRLRVSPEEAAEIRHLADRVGLSVSAYLRACGLGQKDIRAVRQPPVNRQLAARLIGELGRLSHEFRRAVDVADPADCAATIDAVHRDLAELRTLLFEALGREP